MEIKLLEWEKLGDGSAYRAPLPIFGSLRVEKWGGNWEIVWSVPGYCCTFTEGVFGTADEAKAAAQADFEDRIRAFLLPPAPTTGDTHEPR